MQRRILQFVVSGKAFDIALLVVIVLSVIVVMLDSVQGIRHRNAGIWRRKARKLNSRNNRSGKPE